MADEADNAAILENFRGSMPVQRTRHTFRYQMEAIRIATQAIRSEASRNNQNLHERLSIDLATRIELPSRPWD